MSIDIDSLLIQSDLKENTAEELTAISGAAWSVLDAFTDGITAIGTLSFWAADNIKMGDGEMRAALKGIGSFLSIAAPFMDKVSVIMDDAYSEMRNRREGLNNEPK